MVEYKYDAWGNITTSFGTLKDTLGKLNPFRYRGYAYDAETGLYYLISRYYSPNRCRFINRDILIGKVSMMYQHNGYCYARNNCLTMGDSDGNATVNILYDARPSEEEGGKGFPKQAQYWQEALSAVDWQVEMFGFTDVNTFIHEWNSMPECDYLIIIAHGAEGTLDCNGQRIGISYEGGSQKYPITHLTSMLDDKCVNERVDLYTCNGATSGYMGVSFAKIIANKTNATVLGAKYAKVNYYDNAYPYLSSGEKIKGWLRWLLRGRWEFVEPD